MIQFHCTEGSRFTRNGGLTLTFFDYLLASNCGLYYDSFTFWQRHRSNVIKLKIYSLSYLDKKAERLNELYLELNWNVKRIKFSFDFWIFSLYVSWSNSKHILEIDF
jgi:hypothetical protein